MRALAGLLAVVTCGFVSAPSWANDASFGGCGGVMAALAGKQACQPVANEDIELVEEELHFVLQPGGSGPAFRGKWKVEGRYVLRNHGEAQTVTIGFPIRTPWGEEFERRGEKASALEGYRVTLDGVEIPAQAFVASTDGDEKACEAAAKFGYSHAYLSEVTFAAGQTVTLVHTFEHPTGSNYYGYVWFEYILKTGGLWRGGKIGKAHITLEVQEPIAPCFASSLPDVLADWDAQRFEWTLTDFVADKDFSAIVVLSRVAAYFVIGFVDEFEPSGASDGEKPADSDPEAPSWGQYSDDDLLRADLDARALYRQAVPTRRKQKREQGYGDKMTCRDLVDLEDAEKWYGSDGQPQSAWGRPLSGMPASYAGADVIPEETRKRLASIEAELRRRKVKHPVLGTKK